MTIKLVIALETSNEVYKINGITETNRLVELSSENLDVEAAEAVANVAREYVKAEGGEVESVKRFVEDAIELW